MVWHDLKDRRERVRSDAAVPRPATVVRMQAVTPAPGAFSSLAASTTNTYTRTYRASRSGDKPRCSEIQNISEGPRARLGRWDEAADTGSAEVAYCEPNIFEGTPITLLPSPGPSGSEKVDIWAQDCFWETRRAIQAG